MSDEQRNDHVAQMAGDLAEYLGAHLQSQHEAWFTTDDADEYVIEHVQRLDPGQQRRMRAIATALMGLTASALARAGTAPWEQEMRSDNEHLPAMVIQIVPPEEYDRG